MELNPHSLERIVPEFVDSSCPIESESLKLHTGRYLFAAKHISGGNVLDIACGVGYGSEILSASARSVLGVDIDPSAIAYANNHYRSDRIEFRCSDAFSFESEKQFDSIVSLETVEHLVNPEAFLQHLLKFLVREGKLIISVPTTPSTDGNPFHLHDFDQKSLLRLGLKLGLRCEDLFEQVQPLRLSGAKQNRRLQDGMRKNFLGYYLRNPASFGKRVKSLIVDGLNNKYTTAVFVRAPVAAHSST